MKNRYLKNLILLLALFFAGVAHAGTETFTTSGSWEKPSGVTSVTVEVWGGGGSGGGGANTNGFCGGGGAGSGNTKTYQYLLI